MYRMHVSSRRLLCCAWVEAWLAEEEGWEGWAAAAAAAVELSRCGT
jgi:hypothetical protein